MKLIMMQFKLLLFLFSITVIPLAGLYIFLPFDVEYLYLFFVTILIVMRLSVLNDRPFKEGLEPKVVLRFQKKFKKTPSKNQIVALVNENLTARDVAIGINLVLIILITALMGKL